MSHQLWLVVLLAAICTTTIALEKDLDVKPENVEQNEILPGISKTIKISTPKLSKKLINGTTTKLQKSEDDPRYNMSENVDHLNDTSSNTTDKDEYDYYYDYDEDSYDDESTESKSTTESAMSVEKTKTSTAKSEVSSGAIKKVVTIPKLKPIKGDEKIPPKLDDKQELDDATDDLEDDDDDDEDDDDDDDTPKETDDEKSSDISENGRIPCPRDCVCATNENDYLFATCSRLDLDKQKFDNSITDLLVADVGPKYPILLGPEFFLKIGLKDVSAIKITNCTIEYMHEDAFKGLEQLYAVYLINVGLTIVNPNTFAGNKRLRMLTISGNDLSVMSNVHYLLKSDSIEELDLSRNNLMELKPTAFSQLSNIVYINLSKNDLSEIPPGVFDNLTSIEEMDLSYNSLRVLPKGIFNKTTIFNLNLKRNQITGNLDFGATELQHLDLSFCEIKQIHHGMFDNMTQLTVLNLSGNGITKIQPESFLPLKKLRNIDLSINELDQVSSLLFYKNSQLEVIRLNDNPRLSQLPTDGFQSYYDYSSVHLLDLSNCAIGALGPKTFATMKDLNTLKLAWNNINNLGRETFAPLKSLTELDLSNNLIEKLDDLTFMNNNYVHKLSLAGNPLKKLPVRLFMPLKSLKELDVSECELHTLLTDNTNGMSSQYEFFASLESFNASANEIKKISWEDLKLFKNLQTLDISSNPIKCNEAFRTMIVFAKVKEIRPKAVPTMANLNTDTLTEDMSLAPSWDEVQHEICKHTLVDAYRPDEQSKDDIKKSILKGERQEDSMEELMKLGGNKLNQRKKTEEERKLEDDLAEDTSMNEEDDSENIDGNEEEDDSYDDDEEKEEESDIFKSIHDLGLNVKEVDLSKETVEKSILNKLHLDRERNDDGEDDDDDDDDDDDSEEIIIERGRIYYTGYRFFIPALVIVTCVIVLLLAIAKVISLMMRKRGERYRMALLASKDSIVYQKLSEDIIKPNPCKQPKIHRYSPINQV